MARADAFALRYTNDDEVHPFYGTLHLPHAAINYQAPRLMDRFKQYASPFHDRAVLESVQGALASDSPSKN